MDREYSRRDYLLTGSAAGLTGLSGCLDRIPGVGGEEEEQVLGPDPAIQEAAENAEQEMLDDEVLLEYEEADNRLIADSIDVEAEVMREVDIGDAREHRIVTSVELGDNARDLEGYASAARATLVGEKLDEPSYDMHVIVFDNLQQFGETETNVHNNRVGQYETRYEGMDDTFVRYRVSEGNLRNLETREQYLQDFEQNAQIWNGNDWI